MKKHLLFIPISIFLGSIFANEAFGYSEGYRYCSERAMYTAYTSYTEINATTRKKARSILPACQKTYNKLSKYHRGSKNIDTLGLLGIISRLNFIVGEYPQAAKENDLLIERLTTEFIPHEGWKTGKIYDSYKVFSYDVFKEQLKQSYRRRYRLAFEMKDYSSSLEFINEFIKSYPDEASNKFTKFWLGRINSRLGNYDEALEWLDASLNQGPVKWGNYERANIYAKSSKVKLACKDFSKALGGDSNEYKLVNSNQFYNSNCKNQNSSQSSAPIQAAVNQPSSPTSRTKPRSTGKTKSGKYINLKIMTQMTYGWAFCGWDSTRKDIEEKKKEGYQVISVIPLQFIGHDWAGNTSVNCIGENVILAR